MVATDFKEKNNRLDNWNSKKKKINDKISVNHKKDGTIKFRIRPWSIWWFEVGENIGDETSSHYSEEKMITTRPCIVISNNNFNHATYNKKIIIMPLTSKKENKKVKHFQYELKATDYQASKDSKNRVKYKGLAKDTLVICNDIKTIDTKRLIEPIYSCLRECDITEVKSFMKKYMGV